MCPSDHLAGFHGFIYIHVWTRLARDGHPSSRLGFRLPDPHHHISQWRNRLLSSFLLSLWHGLPDSAIFNTVTVFPGQLAMRFSLCCDIKEYDLFFRSTIGPLVEFVVETISPGGLGRSK